MAFCKACGKELKTSDVKFCPFCGTAITTLSAEPKQGKKQKGKDKKEKIKEKKEKKEKTTKSRRKALPLVLTCAFLLFVLGAGFAFLYIHSSPNKFVKDLTAAAQLEDSALIAQMVETDGLSLNSQQLTDLMTSLRQSGQWSDIAEHLLALAKKEAGSSKYDALSIRSEPLFWFWEQSPFSSYKVILHPVQLRVVANGEDCEVTVEPGPGKIEPAGEGEWTASLPPGQHTVTATLETGYDQLVLEQQVSQLSTSSDENVATFEFPVFPVTVRCDGLGTADARVLVNGQPAEGLTVSNGAVQIPYAQESMEVAVEALIGGRTTVETLVVHEEAKDYVLHFGSGQGGSSSSSTAAPGSSDYRKFGSFLSPAGDSDEDDNDDGDEDELAAIEILHQYYASFIQCINMQSLTPLAYVSDEYYYSISQRIEKNKDYLFQYQHMQVDLDTVHLTEKNGEKLLELVVLFEYEYCQRDNPNLWTGGGSTQTCTLVYSEAMASWLVSDTVVDNSITLSDNTMIYK